MLMVCNISDSAAKIVSDENQSSAIDVRRRFLIIRTRLRTRSAELLVTANDAKILYRTIKCGYEDISNNTRNGFMKLWLTHLSASVKQNTKRYLFFSGVSICVRILYRKSKYDSAFLLAGKTFLSNRANKSIPQSTIMPL